MAERGVENGAAARQDWRDAWMSEGEIGMPLGSSANAPGGPAKSDALAHALEEFPTEALPAPPAPAIAPAPRPRRDPLAMLVGHPRRLVAAAVAGTIALSAVVMGLRPEPARPYRQDVVLHELLPAAAVEAERVEPPASSRPARATREVSPGPAAEGLRGAGSVPAALTAPPTRRSIRGDTPAAPVPPPRVGRSAGSGPATPARATIANAPARNGGTAPAAGPPAPAPAADPIAVTAERAPMPSPAPPRSRDVAPSASAPTDRQIIQGVLRQYQTALSRLDAQALEAIWPGLDTPAFTRAFGQLERQAVSFNECSVAIYGNDATARCQGRASYVPRVGPRDERVDDRQWRIELRKAEGAWRIVGVDARE